MTALAVMGLVPHPIGRIAGGEIRFGSEDLVAVGEDRLRDIRGNDISMIFQEPMTSLNPVYSVGEQIAEVLRRHQGLNHKQAWQHAVELLHAVGIPDAAARVSTYPHQMSGGQRQRVMIAMALACKPKILIADEPTTALDVTVQAQIFDLLRVLQRETGTAIVLITHDMGAVCELAERMMVMYAGRKVEEGTVDDVIANPRHPYTQGLISCVPHVTDDPSAERAPLVEISGIVPALRDFGADQCLFAARCQQVVARCAAERPVSNDFGSGHRVACWQAEVGS
jgi:peptide/nickel transport system ATP-binding protein/oligopeptide transport system ATP-binding protein